MLPTDEFMLESDKGDLDLCLRFAEPAGKYRSDIYDECARPAGEIRIALCVGGMRAAKV